MRPAAMSRAVISGRHDPRLWLLVVALAALLAALAVPAVTLERPTRDLLVVVDVTGSMNVRDYTAGGRPVSRLGTAKAAVRDMLAGLPCGSKLGLGIFTERRSFLLFEPVEVCDNFSALDGAIAGLDWRMAWEGDSYVARGGHSGIGLASGLDADLVFLTDGQEAPPLAGDALPPFEGEPGKVGGVLVGVGGREPSPIPKFDEDGREAGFYGEEDVPQENRSGPPPADAESRPGYNPRNAPWGGEAATGSEHLSAMRAEHLTRLAAQTGLGFAPLTAPSALLAAVEAHTRIRPVERRVDLAPVPAGLALLALLALFALGLTGRRPDALPA